MSQKNPFGKLYTVSSINPGPTTIPAVGPGNDTGLPKKTRKKRRKKKKKSSKKRQEYTYFDFLNSD